MGLLTIRVAAENDEEWRGLHAWDIVDEHRWLSSADDGHWGDLEYYDRKHRWKPPLSPANRLAYGYMHGQYRFGGKFRIEEGLTVWVPPCCATQYGLEVDKAADWLDVSVKYDMTENERQEVDYVLKGPQREYEEEIERNRKVDLYRYFDAIGELLYVGQSLSAFRRASQHRQDSGWWRQVKRMEREEVSAAQVKQLEREAIEREKPRYNVTYNRNKLRDDVRSLRQDHSISEVARQLNCSENTVCQYQG